ncbi:ATP-binding protein [Gilvimarinus sp. F26214L]|uniref:ATP-binding protein n=1 Tax=Gilvimarinus sp. DZF01 TaxID=3461371 RepID=UPI0040458834
MTIDWRQTPAAIWRARRASLRPVRDLDPIRLDQLLGIDAQKERIVHNTERFLRGQSANNALLWGSRGTGKSSLVKALLNRYFEEGLRIIEVDKDDLVDLPEIVDEIRELSQRFVIFCDDLSFSEGENSYKAMKSVLEGSIERPPENVVIYATSNRRHLMPESRGDNNVTEIVAGELHYGDAVEEKLSLADRFGLWLSFYPINWEEYFQLVDSYFEDYSGDRKSLHEAARQFALLRASHSGRTAKQFYLSRKGEQL